MPGEQGQEPNQQPKPAEAQQDEQKPAGQPEGEKKPEASNDEQADPLAEMKAQFEKTQKELEALKAEKAEKEEAERQAKLTAEQKLAEQEQRLKQTERKAMIAEVRFNNGFTDPVYSDFQPKGDKAEEIKAEFDAYKAKLEAFAKAQMKPATGSPSGSGAPDPKKSPSEKVPRALKYGIVNRPSSVS